MKKRLILSAVVAVTLFALFPATALADSSWLWISQTRPWDVLPWVVAETLFIEVFAINFIPRLGQFFKVLWVVLLANLISFGVPYLIQLAVSASNTAVYTVAEFFEHTPVFTFDLGYFVLTLAAELPFVYYHLKKEQPAPVKKLLLFAIIGSNTLTTAINILVERTFCYGNG